MEETIPNKDLPKIAEKSPAEVRVFPGKEYKWCTCGLTRSEPFCDERHKLIEDKPFKSLRITFEEEKDVLFCRCKQTKTPPFCDNSHKKL